MRFPVAFIASAVDCGRLDALAHCGTAGPGCCAGGFHNKPFEYLAAGILPFGRCNFALKGAVFQGNKGLAKSDRPNRFQGQPFHRFVAHLVCMKLSTGIFELDLSVLQARRPGDQHPTGQRLGDCGFRQESAEAITDRYQIIFGLRQAHCVNSTSPV